MKSTDWKVNFSNFNRQLAENSLAFLLVHFDWSKATPGLIDDLADDFGREIHYISPEEYCALLPILLDAISNDYPNLKDSYEIDCLLSMPKTRLEYWEKHVESSDTPDQLRTNAILVAAAKEMGVDFDPDEYPRHCLLGPYTKAQRCVLRKKISILLESDEHHMDYGEHYFADELETLLQLL